MVSDEECALLPGLSSFVSSHCDDPESSEEFPTPDPCFWAPDVADSLRPAMGLQFNTLNEGIQFYMNYGRSGGFDVRHSTVKRDQDGNISMRYLVCSRQGVKGGVGSVVPLVNSDNGGQAKQRRRRISSRLECVARICLRRDKTDKFVVSIFEEKHTHRLCSESSKQFMRINRTLDSTLQAFIASCIKANIGTSQSFKLCKELMSTYGNIGATSVDFHNFKRDLQAYVGHDEENRLARLFWADQVARDNFLVFGDAISFDATYGTNRWCKHTNAARCSELAAASSSNGSRINLLWGEINTCVGMVGSNDGRHTRLLQVMKDLIAEFLNDGSGSDMAKNKGSGKRIKSKRELAIEARARGERKCAACGLYGRHDSRNCVIVPRVRTGKKAASKRRSKQ
nr:protein FAR1-RELATED SEQUENCE 5-like [Ipomoea batatas]